MESNQKINCDDFADITQEIRKSGVNIKQWAAANGFPISTVRFALAGYPRTKRASMIREAAKMAAKESKNARAKICRMAERMFAK